MDKFPEIYRILYRGVRTAIAAALAQTLATQVDWTKPDEAVKAFLSSFVAGFLVALGMWVRDHFKPTDIVSKAMPI